MIQHSEDFPFMQVRIRPYGERGYLLDLLADMDRVWIEHMLTLNPPAILEECVWGAENCLLLFVRPVDHEAVKAWLNQLTGGCWKQSVTPRCIEVPVRYDGPDLAMVATATGLTEAEVVAIHSAPEYRVRIMGFAPGFPYLDGLDERLHLERKASPRNRIEPGAVAIGGSHAGIYSVASPGGWHLLGRTDLPLFQPKMARGTLGDSRDIFTLAAGDVVKFNVI